LLAEGFEHELPDSMVVENDSPKAQWRLTGRQAASGQQSLGYDFPENFQVWSSTGVVVFSPVSIPAVTDYPKLHFKTKENDEHNDNECGVYVVHETGEDLLGVLGKWSDVQGEWVDREFDLSFYKGQVVRVKLEMTSKGLGPFDGFYVDDLKIVQHCCDDDGECDDDNLCTVDGCPGPDSFCDHDWTSGCCLEHAHCDDGDECTLDFCPPGNTCKNVNTCCSDDADCDDGDDLCTQETCIDEVCEFVPTWAEGCCTAPLFSDDFSQDLGWEYGPYWERGPAIASDCKHTYEDPAADHTDSDNNYVAGVKIGGCIEFQEHPFSYLTSPTIPAGEEDTVFLTYARWLNHPMNNVCFCTVEAFDGTDWVNLWTADPWEEAEAEEWQLAFHDISPYANDELRVRFGFNVFYFEPLEIASWNLDDVQILTSLDQTCCMYDSDCDAFETNCFLGTCQ